MDILKSPRMRQLATGVFGLLALAACSKSGSSEAAPPSTLSLEVPVSCTATTPDNWETVDNDNAWKYPEVTRASTLR